jgi:hypothetical protein
MPTIFPDNLTDNQIPSYELLEGDKFWPVVATNIRDTLWNKSKPFQLAMLEPQGDDYGLFELDLFTQFTGSQGTAGKVFTLPFPPEAYSVSMPFAISTTATLGGIVEQHNGAPFRMIGFSGSFGVAPGRGHGGGVSPGFGNPLLNAVGSVFAGTVEAANATLDSASAVFTGQKYASPNVVPDNGTFQISEGDPLFRGTGYYHAMVLRGFLETYATLKKTKPNLRLGLYIWKENAAYLVTPISYDVQRNAAQPLEFRYALQFRAWKRIDPGLLDPFKAINKAIKGVNLTGLSFKKDVLERLTAARNTLRNASKTIRSIQTDFDQSIGAAVRDITLGLKEAVGAARTAADFGPEFGRYFQKEIADRFNDIDFEKAYYNKDLGRQVDQLRDAANAYRSRSGGALSLITQNKISNPLNVIGALLSDPNNEELRKFIDVDSLPLSSVAKAAMERAVLKATTKVRKDYDILRNKIEVSIADYSDKVGLGDETWNQTLGRQTSAQIREATDEDFDVILALTETLNQVSALAAIETENKATINALDYVAGLASENDIAFRVPQSKFAVPFPYGYTLEKLAKQYLADPDRWMEVAVLNNLRAPYVDEVGFTIPIKLNGSGNTIWVNDASKLTLGQTVSVFSSVVTPEKRKIISINTQNTGALISLAGDPDLDKLLVINNPKLHAYSPGTVNSGQFIYIPSDSPLDEELLAQSVPGVEDLTVMAKVGGIDLLLTSTGDLAVTKDGHVPLAVGLTNIIQHIRVALATPKGSMFRHPEFGFSVQVGSSNADFTAASLLEEAKNIFLEDPAIQSIRSASVEVIGPVVRLSVEIAVRGASNLIPISIDVKNTVFR